MTGQSDEWRAAAATDCAFSTEAQTTGAEAWAKYAAPDAASKLFFVRSGWFGTPALADVFWAGDQRTDFEPDDGLPTILPIGIGVGLSGISTYGHDIAGYQSASNPPSTKELFFRWTSLIKS